MNVLALEPFHGGSHKAFLDGWQRHSEHTFTVLGLPPYKWKWRMRHAAVTLSRQLDEPPLSEQKFDVLWCSDMLNLAEFLGLVGEPIRRLPRVAYFHENQLTYPVREERERDRHFAYSNFTTALAADRVWFNSAFHRDEFLNALRVWLSRMPDYGEVDLVDEIEAKTEVQHPGIDSGAPTAHRVPGPLRICWNARWEHDKNPDHFFAAMRLLKSREVEFRLIVLGESFRQSPPIFSAAEIEFGGEIDHWGYAETRDQYLRLLARSDVVVSTAHHEFFGIGIVEATAAGAIPILPNRLAYPEVLAKLTADPGWFIYDGSVDQLAERLESVAETASSDSRLSFDIGPFEWTCRAPEMDAALKFRIGVTK